MKPYSSFGHLVASVCPGNGEDWSFAMSVIDVPPQTVYVDDSGSDDRARIIVAALCTSTVKKWKKFEAAWIAAEQKFGFRNFHMTEFSSCSKDSWCRDCKNGKTNAENHPWREWSNTKRHKVLSELVRIVCKYTTQGFGIALTKQEIDEHIGSPRLKEVAPDFGAEYFTFAATVVHGELAKWRFEINEFPPLKLVFDGEHKLELAKAFLPEHQVKPRFTNGGLEQWFDLGADGIAFENRKITRQLLAPDMLAWVTAKIRAIELFPATFQKRGWPKDVSLVAFPFIDSKKLHMGHTPKESLRVWLENEIQFWEGRKSSEESNGVREIQRNDASPDKGSSQRDSGEIEDRKESKEQAEG